MKKYRISLGYDVVVEAENEVKAKMKAYKYNNEITDMLSYHDDCECTEISVKEEK